jgi:RNA polymerase sigma-70 factor (ECF subfamily)
VRESRPLTPSPPPARAANASEPDDRTLIALAVAGDDRQAFAMLVRRHQSAVRATLRRLAAGNDALADDLAQETFVLAWRNLASFREEARFSTWLYRIATNCWLADARKRKEVLLGDRDGDGDGDDDEDDAMSALGVSVGDTTHATSLRMDMARAMRVLSDGERAAIVQCYDNDLSHEEAAYVLGIPVGTVKTHILRAKKKLKSALADWA